LRGGEAQVGARRARLRVRGLAGDPVAEVRVGERLEVVAVELMVVDERGETVLAAVPDVPDEGALVEQRAVLGEEVVELSSVGVETSGRR